MIYLLIFFLDEGRTSLYGSPVTPSIQGITYRPILLAALSSRAGQFSVLIDPIHVVILSGPCAVERSLQSISWARTRPEFSSRSSCPFTLEVITIQDGGYPSPGLLES